MNQNRHFSAVSGGEVSSPARRHLLLKENAAPTEEETIEHDEAVESEESETEDNFPRIYDVEVQGEYLVVSEEVRDALLPGPVTGMSGQNIEALQKWLTVARNRARIGHPLQ